MISSFQILHEPRITRGGIMTHKGSNVRFPSEFEEQEAVWLG